MAPLLEHGWRRLQTNALASGPSDGCPQRRAEREFLRALKRARECRCKNSYTRVPYAVLEARFQHSREALWPGRCAKA